MTVRPGAVVSTTNALFAPSDPDAPGEGSVRSALLPPLFWIVPPFKASALVDL